MRQKVNNGYQLQINKFYENKEEVVSKKKYSMRKVIYIPYKSTYKDIGIKIMQWLKKEGLVLYCDKDIQIEKRECNNDMAIVVEIYGTG